MTTPHIIRTAAEYERLQYDAIVINRRGSILRAVNIWPDSDLPAVVIATGDQVRAARKALEEA